MIDIMIGASSNTTDIFSSFSTIIEMLKTFIGSVGDFITLVAQSNTIITGFISFINNILSNNALSFVFTPVLLIIYLSTAFIVIDIVRDLM